MDLASHRWRVVAFECNFCDKLFKRKELLVKHLSSHQEQEKVPEPVLKQDTSNAIVKVNSEGGTFEQKTSKNIVEAKDEDIRKIAENKVKLKVSEFELLTKKSESIASLKVKEEYLRRKKAALLFYEAERRQKIGSGDRELEDSGIVSIKAKESSNKVNESISQQEIGSGKLKRE